MSRRKTDDELPRAQGADPGTLSPAAARARCDDLARRVLDSHNVGRGYDREFIREIWDWTQVEDPQVQTAATMSLFKGLIEPLNDSFDPDRADLADRVLAQLIISHKSHKSNPRFSAKLDSFGLGSEEDLLGRRARAAEAPVEADPRMLRKVVVLSRVTVGADVAVTSVIIDHLETYSPNAEIVLVGPAKLRDLFGGDPALRFSPAGYERGGRLADRLDSWMQLSEVISRDISGLGPGEFLVVDPDSRLTQLGLLPVTRDQESYTLFDSRRFSQGSDLALGEAAYRWAATRFPIERSGDRSFPFVSPQVDAPFDRLVRGLRKRSGKPAVFVSFGVGGNESKQVSPLFEELLMRQLAEEATLIIDKGASEIEGEKVDRIVEVLADEGRSIVEVSETSFDSEVELNAGIVAWRGGISSFAKLVEACDAYIGYDSAGQHIAAALGRPTLTIFVNCATPRFAKRWTPTGRSPVRVLALTPRDVDEVSAKELAERAHSLFRELAEGLGPVTAG